MARTAMLSCGLIAPALFVAMSFFVGFFWEGYSTTSQTISELSAIDAPTRRLWLMLVAVYSVALVTFGATLRRIASDRPVRLAGTVLVFQGVLGALWPPMHQRAVLAAGGATLTDTLHIAWTVFTSLSFLLAIALAASALGPRFRRYSLATMVIMVGAGLWTATYAPLLEANLPTPGAGVWERVNTTAFMVWIAVLAITVWRREDMTVRGGPRGSRPRSGQSERARAPQRASTFVDT